MKLLDTSVLIDIDIGGKEVREKAKELDAEGRHAISTISLYEFYWGIYRKQLKEKKLVSWIPILRLRRLCTI